MFLISVSALSKYSFEPIRCCLLSLGADMRRREFITLLGGAAAAWPLAARAQQPGRVRRIGVLLPGNSATAARNPRMQAFYKALQELGWIEGQNVAFERRWAE